MTLMMAMLSAIEAMIVAVEDVLTVWIFLMSD
jgi:hypothetical protein